MTQPSDHPSPPTPAPEPPAPGDLSAPAGPVEAKRLPPVLVALFTLVSVVVAVAVIGGVALMTAQRIEDARSEGQGGLPILPEGVHQQAPQGPAPAAFRLPEGAKPVAPEFLGQPKDHQTLVMAEVPGKWQAADDFFRVQAVKSGWTVVSHSPPRDGRGTTLTVAKSGWERIITIREKPGGQTCTVGIVDK